MASFTIQTTTPYNLLWLDYGKYFSKSQALSHSRRDSPREGVDRAPAEEEERKSLLDEGHELDRKKHAEKAGRQKLPPETVKRIEKGG